MAFTLKSSETENGAIKCPLRAFFVRSLVVNLYRHNSTFFLPSYLRVGLLCSLWKQSTQNITEQFHVCSINRFNVIWITSKSREENTYDDMSKYKFVRKKDSGAMTR